MAKKEKLMAFWSHDIFPYTLCGEVIHIGPEGQVKVKGYGTMRFIPIKIVPYEEGLEYKKKLEELKLEHREETEKLHARLLAEIPFKDDNPRTRRYLRD